MAWMSMRRSVPCVLRHHGDAANDPEVKLTESAARLPHRAFRWLAVLVLVSAVTAFSVSRGGASGVSAREESNWRTACLFALLDDARLNRAPRELCAP
jgi:hypothetical protein